MVKNIGWRAVTIFLPVVSKFANSQATVFSSSEEVFIRMSMPCIYRATRLSASFCVMCIYVRYVVIIRRYFEEVKIKNPGSRFLISGIYRVGKTEGMHRTQQTQWFPGRTHQRAKIHQCLIIIERLFLRHELRRKFPNLF